MHPLSTENKSLCQLYHSYSQDSSLFDEAIYPSIYGCDEEESEVLDDDIDDDTDAVVILTTQLALSQDSLKGKFTPKFFCSNLLVWKRNL